VIVHLLNGVGKIVLREEALVFGMLVVWIGHGNQYILVCISGSHAGDVECHAPRMRFCATTYKM
jgi:hypothetical protein